MIINIESKLIPYEKGYKAFVECLITVIQKGVLNMGKKIGAA